MIEWLLFVLIGMATGLFAGLLGLGGGLVVVPSLFAILSAQGVAQEQLMHSVVATSLMTIVVTSLASTLSHHRLKTINWSMVRRLTPMLIVGGFAGAYLSSMLSSSILKYCFIVYALSISIKMWSTKESHSDTHLAKNSVIYATAGGVGIISALVGIGGGSLIVPYLLRIKLSIQNAIATSAVCGFPISLAAVIGFMVFTPNHQTANNLIDWQAFIGIISSSIIFAGIGAKWAQSLPVKKLKRIFSLVLLAGALSLLF